MKNTSMPVNLTRFAWISIAAAVITITLKLSAYWLTNSVGLLSDAMESFVNLVAAIVALLALRIASRPADEEFSFGYSKVEFFSSGFEGGMILIAAGSIAFTAVQRLLNPQPIEQVGLGLLISVIASLLNLGVSRLLSQAGERYESITLSADARHLMTDVITTGGVIVGVGLVSVTGLVWLDPVIALVVAVNILFTGAHLLQQSYKGLMDISLPAAELTQIQEILKTYETQGIKFHAVRSRSAAARRFVSMHILVPGAWSVQRAHETAEQIENKIRVGFPQIAIFTHVEPLEDPASWEDSRLEKE
jgi:cation diffusion facilitator family transporter